MAITPFVNNLFCRSLKTFLYINMDRCQSSFYLYSASKAVVDHFSCMIHKASTHDLYEIVLDCSWVSLKTEVVYGNYGVCGNYGVYGNCGLVNRLHLFMGFCNTLLATFRLLK